MDGAGLGRALHPWVLDSDGMLAIPSTPGLGLELDADALRRYTRGERLLEP